MATAAAGAGAVAVWWYDSGGCCRRSCSSTSSSSSSSEAVLFGLCCLEASGLDRDNRAYDTAQPFLFFLTHTNASIILLYCCNGKHTRTHASLHLAHTLPHRFVCVVFIIRFTRVVCLFACSFVCRIDSQAALGKMEKWRQRKEALPEYEQVRLRMTQA